MLEIFDDPFVLQRLNPLFLQELQNYWTILSSTQHGEAQKHLQVQQNLHFFLFRRLFQPLYLKYPPMAKGKLYFLTTVRPDGTGDYFATLKSAKIWQQAHPETDVHVVYTHQLPLPRIDSKDYFLQSQCIHDFLETTDRPILEPVLEGIESLPFEVRLAELIHERHQTKEDYEQIVKSHGQSIQSLADLVADYDRQIQHLQQFQKTKKKALALYEVMKSSLAIVNIALAINTFENPLLVAKSLYFAEAGNFQGIANFLNFNWFSMGLEPFEEGIFLGKTFPQSSLPKQADCNIYVAYLPKITEQRLIFICLVCLMQKGDRRSIDIFLPKLDEDEPFSLNPHWLALQGVSKVVLVDKKGKENLLLTTGITSAKELRLVQALPVPPAEFENIIAASGDVVGCTGDGSLSDCLIAGKIPFYELRKHKLQTWQGFQSIAEHLQLNDVKNYLQTLEMYKEQKAEKVAETLFSQINSMTFRSQWDRLRAFISKYYCFEEALISHVNRHVLLGQFPALHSLEEKLVKANFKGQLTAEQAMQILEERLELKLRCKRSSTLSE